MALTTEQRQALRKRRTLVVPGFDVPDAAAQLRQRADWCERQGVEHDVYGKGFERKVAALLGKPAAVFTRARSPSRGSCAGMPGSAPSRKCRRSTCCTCISTRPRTP
jgi:hypothetical protein